MDIRIRNARLEDAVELTSLLKGIGWFTHLQSEPFASSQARISQHLKLCLDGDSHSVYVAESDQGELIGYLSIHWLPYLFMQGPEGFISELFVRESGRGQGIGTRLLEAAKQEARDRGCYRLSLLNGRHRESYQRGFYEQHGWEERAGMANFVYWL